MPLSIRSSRSWVNTTRRSTTTSTISAMARAVTKAASQLPKSHQVAKTISTNASTQTTGIQTLRLLSFARSPAGFGGGGTGGSCGGGRWGGGGSDTAQVPGGSATRVAKNQSTE